MSMDSRFREYVEKENELVVPVARGQLPAGDFLHLFPHVFYDSEFGTGAALGRVYVENADEVNEATAKFDENGTLGEARYDSRVRTDIIEGVLTQVARRRGTTVFRLLSGATPEQEAAFNFFDSELNGEFGDYVWAASWGGVQPEDIFTVDQMGGFRLRGILRASQGRANAENGVRIQHVARVLSFAPKMTRDHVQTPGWSGHVEEMSKGVSLGLFDDSVLRTLAACGFESKGFKVAVDLLLDGVPQEYAFECARGVA